MNMGTVPILGLVKTIGLFLSFKVKFHREDINKILEMEDGKKFRVFRHVEIQRSRKADPEAVFVVRFTPENMTVKQNIRFSLLPMMIFMGFKGFRSKYWCVDDTSSMCQGIYQWQTVEDAVQYSNSIAMRFMTNRSIPGTVSSEVIDQSKHRYWVFHAAADSTAVESQK